MQIQKQRRKKAKLTNPTVWQSDWHKMWAMPLPPLTKHCTRGPHALFHHSLLRVRDPFPTSQPPQLDFDRSNHLELAYNEE